VTEPLPSIASRPAFNEVDYDAGRWRSENLGRFERGWHPLNSMKQQNAKTPMTRRFRRGLAAGLAAFALTGAAAGMAAAPASAAPASVTPASAVSTSTWDKLAKCESGGNWSINTGNGYYGGLQFSPATWKAHGGKGNPAHASKAKQIAVAKKVLKTQGWGAWPACSAKLGLRA